MKSSADLDARSGRLTWRQARSAAFTSELDAEFTLGRWRGERRRPSGPLRHRSCGRLRWRARPRQRPARHRRAPPGHEHSVTTTTFDESTPHTHDVTPKPAATAVDGYELRLDGASTDGHTLRYRIVGPDGATVTEFADNHGGTAAHRRDPRRPQWVPAHPSADRCRRHVDGHRAGGRMAPGRRRVASGSDEQHRAGDEHRRRGARRLGAAAGARRLADRRRNGRHPRRADVHRHDTGWRGRHRLGAVPRRSRPPHRHPARATWPTPTCTRPARRWPGCRT